MRSVLVRADRLGSRRGADRLGGRQPAQIIVLFALFVIVLTVLAGSAYDYASIVIDEAKLQNAVDAAALAGSDTLAANSSQSNAVTLAKATATQYLSDNHVDSTNATITLTELQWAPPPGVQAPNPPLYDGLSVDVVRQHATAFWQLVGINSVTLHEVAQAHGAHSMVDVMLSLDTTGSLAISGDLEDKTSGAYYPGGPTVKNAVVNFINALNPVPGDQRGPRIGIGRYAGIMCGWIDSNKNGVVDVYSASSPQSEYRGAVGHTDGKGNCTDDETLLTPLTDNKDQLLELANASGTSSTCPTFAVGYACPLQHHPYILPGAPALKLNNQTSLPGYAPYYTGTKEPNAICLINPGDSHCTDTPTGSGAPTEWAWTSHGAYGGRNGPVSAGQQARRVLIIMTDGQDEAWPTSNAAPGSTDYAFPEDAQGPHPNYDDTFKALASAIKTTPPDASSGYPPVEVYVVGFFCTNQSYGQGFCQSKIAFQPQGSRACPGAPGSTYTPGSTGSSIDDLLVNVSSSTVLPSGKQTCDHYFPISKSDVNGLNQLFLDLAGTISRGQLTQ